MFKKVPITCASDIGSKARTASMTAVGGCSIIARCRCNTIEHRRRRLGRQGEDLDILRAAVRRPFPPVAITSTDDAPSERANAAADVNAAATSPAKMTLRPSNNGRTTSVYCATSTAARYGCWR